MKTITTQQQARPVQSLGFCFFCGGVFATERECINAPDHLPPKAVFHPDDRNWRLKVACHWCCNQERSITDTKSGQLIGATRGQYPKTKDIALNVEPWRIADDEIPVGILSEFNFQAEIWRWVRGFHAALYGEYLPADGGHRTYPPIPSGEMTAEGPQFNEDHLHVQAGVVQQIKMNAAVGRLDEIKCNNGKLHYMCLWAPPFDRGQWECWFALKIYDWQTAGDPRFPQRACIGRYAISDVQPPTDASVGVTIEIPVASKSPLDPFTPVG